MKIFKFLSIVITMNLLMANLKCQIIYTDLNPGILIYANYPTSNNTTDTIVKFDINQDSINDFAIHTNRSLVYLSPSSGYGEIDNIWVLGLDTCFKLGYNYSQGSACTFLAVDSGAIINNQYTWNTSIKLSYMNEQVFYFCSPGGKKIFPIRFYFNQAYHYGWIRLQAGGAYAELFDMALNLTPNQDIIAGQTILTNISENNFVVQKIVIYPNPVHGKCFIKIPPEFLHSKVLSLSIYNNIGELILQYFIESNNIVISVNFEVEAKGIYNVVLTNGKKNYTGRIIFE